MNMVKESDIAGALGGLGELEKKIVDVLYKSRKEYPGGYPPGIKQMITFSGLSGILDEDGEKIHEVCSQLMRKGIASTYVAHGIFGIQMSTPVCEYMGNTKYLP